MKFRVLLASLVLGFCSATLAPAQTPPPTPLMQDLQAIIDRVVQARKTSPTTLTPASLAPELAALDALRIKYPAKDDDSAQVVILKGMIYSQLLNDDAKAREIFATVIKEFPGTESAKGVEKTLAQMDRAAKAKAVVAGLVGKAAPELHFKWSSQGDLTTLSALKGKVVVLDFWATWCGPCIASFPQVREHVEHFKGSPVTFVGVTSIQGSIANMGPKIDTKGNPEKEMSLMADFMKAKNMTWEVAFSEEQVFNPDFGIQGIPYLAIIAPDGTVRHAGLHPGDPSADISGKIEAILKEFNLPVPKKAE
jgi:thiol-disulfide isomerase/thioredoxin